MRPAFAFALGLLASTVATLADPIQPLPVTEWKAVYGRIEARDRLPARARLGGTVVSLTVTEGDAVTAGQVLAEVVAQALEQPGVLAAAARHRVGRLEVGDIAFVAAVSAAHRREAFTACAWLVDEAKSRLPIWKHQHFADGSDEWVNSP